MKVINNKYTLIAIIGMLVVSIGFLATSIILRVIGFGYETYVDPNPTHELLHDGKLYFYDQMSKELGTYTCKKNYKYCGLAIETVDDADYGFRAYSDGNDDTVKPENNRYAFIVDTELDYQQPGDANVILYDFKKGKAIKEFAEVKNYTVGLTDNIVFVKELEGGWRILILKGPEMTYLTDYFYQYVSVHNELATNSSRLNASNIVTYDGTSWQIINDIGSERTDKTTKQIVDYSTNYIIYRVNDLYQLQTLNDFSLLNGQSFKELKFVKGFATYAEVANIDDDYYIVDFNLNKDISNRYHRGEYPDIHSRITDDKKIEIISNGNILETVK